MTDFAAAFDEALDYADFLERFGTPPQRDRWADVYQRIRLSKEQSDRLRAFVREMRVLCLAGVWCGDCAEQCPIFRRFAETTACIRLRFVDRDASPALAEKLRICGGGRVPVVVFLSEDGYECGRYGDRTWSKYRSLAWAAAGEACSTGLAADEEVHEAVVEDWLREFERIQWMLRLSPRLRKRHGD
ncbi:MAG: thiol reductase thioredoxin [Planctomycetota bacterium]|nr:MAG: thiol reductase thioredoxin [Planctomycetota bacterium]